MTYSPTPSGDPTLEMAQGNVSSYIPFTESSLVTDIPKDTPFDVWNGSNEPDNQYTFVVPTLPQIHEVVSTDVNDSEFGTGARTIVLFGIETWDGPEVLEIVTLDGTSVVETTRTWVAINFCSVITFGSGMVNLGKVTVTAKDDSTITTQISPSEGRAHIAAIGISSVQDGYLPSYWASIGKSMGVPVDAVVSLVLNPFPNEQNLIYRRLDTFMIFTNGTSYGNYQYNPYRKVRGPCHVKITGVTNQAGAKISAGFGAFLTPSSSSS